MRRAELLRIAGRYTLAWRGGYLSSFLSLLSVLGMVLAISLLLLVLSVMNGFDREMRDNILGLVPQLNIRSWVPVQEWEAFAARIDETRCEERHPASGARCVYITGHRGPHNPESPDLPANRCPSTKFRYPRTQLRGPRDRVLQVCRLAMGHHGSCRYVDAEGGGSETPRGDPGGAFGP